MEKSITVTNDKVEAILNSLSDRSDNNQGEVSFNLPMISEDYSFKLIDGAKEPLHEENPDILHAVDGWDIVPTLDLKEVKYRDELHEKTFHAKRVGKNDWEIISQENC